MKLDYKWVIAATLFLVFTLLMGFATNTGSLYIVPVTEHFGFSRGDFSLMFTLTTVSNAVFQIFYGLIARRFGVRNMVVTGVILGPLGYLIFSNSFSLAGFYAGGVIFGISLALSALTSVFVLVNNWFDKGQGTVLGVIVAGSGVGGAAASLLIGQEIVFNGFQSAYLLTAALLSIAILPVIFLIKSAPSAGPAGAEHAQASSGSAHPEPAAVPMSERDFLKNPTLMLGALAIFLLGFTVHPVWANTPAYLVDKGYSQLFASGVFSVILLVIGAAKIGLGFLHDRLGMRVTLLVGYGSLVIAAVLIPLASSEWLIWVYTVFDGISLATLSILAPLFARALLGKDNYSSFLGIYLAVMNIGAGVGMPLMNYAYDNFGTYDGITLVYAGLGVLALLVADRTLKKSTRRVR